MLNQRQEGEELPLLHQSSEKFPEVTHYRDPWFAIVFTVQFLIFLVLGIYSIISLYDDSSTDLPSDINYTDIFKWTLALFAISFIAIAVFINLLIRYPVRMVWVCSLSFSAFYMIIGLFSLFLGNTIQFIIYTVLACFVALIVYLTRKRIAFAAVLIEFSARITKERPKTYLVSFMSAFFQCIWFMIWAFAVFFIYNNYYNDDDDNQTKNSLLYFLLLISLYWASQVLMNIAHTTNSGVVSTWYFFPADEIISPVWRSLKRALTTSFGSICFGSLLIAIIKALRGMASDRRNSNILGLIAGCILYCFERIMEYFNHYAFVYVAIYGFDYITAGKSVFTLFKSRGFDVVINDNYVGFVLIIGSLSVGGVTAIVPIIYEEYVWALFGLTIGFVVALVLFSTLQSAISTLLVCFAEDPAILAENNPEAYSKFTAAIAERYPQVVFYQNPGQVAPYQPPEANPHSSNQPTHFV